MTKTSKPKPQVKQQKPKEKKTRDICALGVPRIFYRGSLFLASKKVTPQVRAAYGKSFFSGTVVGALGQMHLDVMEAIFCNQLHLTESTHIIKCLNDDNTSEERVLNVYGVVFDPYLVKKALQGRMDNNRIYHYINEIIKTEINIVFTPPDSEPIIADTPIILRIDSYKKVFSSNLKINRELKCIYIPNWFFTLCGLTPYFDHKVVFFNTKNPIEQAINRYMSTLDESFKRNLSEQAICSGAGIETSPANLELVRKVLNPPVNFQ